MTKPWQNDPIVQRGGISATPLPRHPDDIAREQRDAEEKRRREARDNRGESYDRGDRSFDEAEKLRKEYQGQPSVVEYQVALGTFNSALNTSPSAQGDQSLITSYAKMLDPNSVVREGEFAVTASTEGVMNQIKARMAKEFGWSEGGMLTADGRKAIRSEMRNLVTQRFQPAYNRDRMQYERLAREYGVDPYKVIGEDAKSQFPKNLLAEPGADKKLEDLPPGYQDAVDAFVKAGNFTPEQYAALRSGLDKAFFSDAADQTDTYLREGQQIIDNGGVPGGPVPGVETQMGAVEGAVNSAMQHPLGSFAANAVNASMGGLPAALSGNQADIEALREMNPGSSFMGEVAGGIGGALGAGKFLGAVGGGSKLLANPMAAEAAFGGTYGATQDTENPFRGALVGTGSALTGGMLGRKIGEAMPGLFARGAVRQADESVPTIDQLKAKAGEQYTAAEAAGDLAQPDATRALLDTTNSILAREGRLTPRGNLIDMDTPITRAHTLINDFAGEPMTPTQAGSVREVLGEGLMAKEPNQRRIAGQMMDEFDQWADPVLPGIADARETASRYLQGQEIAKARELANANSQWYSQSGLENSTRAAFRDMDRATIRGKSKWDDAMREQIETVSRGTPLSNASRFVGKFAPTGVVSSLPAITIGLGTGAGTGGLTGALAGATVAGAGLLGRKIATAQTTRAAEVAELMARGGLDYQRALEAATDIASRRAGRIGGGLFGSSGSAVTR